MGLSEEDIRKAVEQLRLAERDAWICIKCGEEHYVFGESDYRECTYCQGELIHVR